MTSRNRAHEARIEALKRDHANAYAKLREVEREHADEGGRVHAADPMTWRALAAEYQAIAKVEDELIVAFGIATGASPPAEGGRRCVICGRAMGIYTRSDAVTCSSSCRGKLFRQRGGKR